MACEINDSQMFNYSDIFFSYYTNDEQIGQGVVKDHVLAYVFSGEMVLHEGKTKSIVRKGECVFLRKDNRLGYIKQSVGKEPFRGISLVFKRSLLREFYRSIDEKQLPVQVQKRKQSVIKLTGTPAVISLFQSMLPYFDTSTAPTDRIIEMKLHEGIYALLDIDAHFYPSLFDFTEPWKIDIMDFLENNYTYDLTIEDIANYTGRSLATFKRDFKKLSDLSPQKWLMEKRLNDAHNKIVNENKKTSDVYLEVGFKNLSHFSTAYKKQFGVSPSK